MSPPDRPSDTPVEASEPADERLFVGDDPLGLFQDWMASAAATEPNDPNAMTVATADAAGLPDARMVLLKGVDPRGFVFYTNTESAKGRQLDANPQAALLFHWKTLRRQVRVRGRVERVSDEEADAYFATRPRDSQIGAWASDQSRPMEGRFVLEKRAAELALSFGLGRVPRPPHWTGYRILPLRMEFWRDRPFRLHDRLVFERGTLDGAWTRSRLFP
jgi:pyridoxamine 5'-phosphate oxidase